MVDFLKQPVIKWPGSKRPVADCLGKIWNLVVSVQSRYFDPFVGGGSMLVKRPVRIAYAGNIINELIELWRAIQTDPNGLSEHYRKLYEQTEKEKQIYYAVRQRFNKNRSPYDFLYLSRMCINGRVRFNAKGEFNSSLALNRGGIRPQTLAFILHTWSIALQGVEFCCRDYRETLELVYRGDLVFLDPPYFGTQNAFYSQREFTKDDFWQTIERLNCIGAFWMMTLDGSAGDREYEFRPPVDLYKRSFSIETGDSSFAKMRGKKEVILESVYINF